MASVSIGAIDFARYQLPADSWFSGWAAIFMPLFLFVNCMARIKLMGRLSRTSKYVALIKYTGDYAIITLGSAGGQRVARH